MNTILITGTAGFIGFHLSSYLSKDNNIIGIDNLNNYYDIELKKSRLEILNKLQNFTFIKGDITDSQFIEKIFNQYEPEIVINLAAQAGVRYSIDFPDLYIQSNIVGFFTILEKCRTHKIKHLLFASSSSIYGNQTKIPFSETDITDTPISLYAATKKSNEEMGYAYSSLYRVPITALRLFTVYGPYGRPDMAYYNFTKKILNEETIEVYNNGEMYRDFTYIDDVVKSISKLISCPPNSKVPFDVYNIGKGEPDKLIDFIKILEKEIGKKAQIMNLPMQPGDVFQTYADTKKIENKISYKPTTDLNTGLSKFVKWYMDYYK